MKLDDRIPDHARRALERCAMGETLFSSAACGHAFAADIQADVDDTRDGRFTVLLMIAPADLQRLRPLLPAVLAQGLPTSERGAPALSVWDAVGGDLARRLRLLPPPPQTEAARARPRRLGALPPSAWNVVTAGPSPLRRVPARLLLGVMDGDPAEDPQWLEFLSCHVDLHLGISPDDGVPALAPPERGCTRLVLPQAAAANLVDAIDAVLAASSDAIAMHRCARLLARARVELAFEVERLAAIADWQDRQRRSAAKARPARVDAEIITRVARAREIAEAAFSRIEGHLGLDDLGVLATQLAVNLSADDLETLEKRPAGQASDGPSKLHGLLFNRVFVVRLRQETLDDLGQRISRACQRRLADDADLLQRELGQIEQEIAERLSELAGCGVEVPAMDFGRFKDSPAPDFRRSAEITLVSEEKHVRTGLVTDFQKAVGLVMRGQSILMLFVVGGLGLSAILLGEAARWPWLRPAMSAAAVTLALAWLWMHRSRVAPTDEIDRYGEMLDKFRSRLVASVEAALQAAGNERTRFLKRHLRQLKDGFDRFWFELDARLRAQQEDEAARRARREQSNAAALGIAQERLAQAQAVLKMLSQASIGTPESARAAHEAVLRAARRLHDDAAAAEPPPAGPPARQPFSFPRPAALRRGTGTAT